MKYSQLMEQVRQEVVRFFKINDKAGFTYHNLDHTESVVANAQSIGSHYRLDERDIFIVTTAAWFHDTGYFNGGAIDHELRGADKAELFLKDKGIENDTIQAIRNCIIATRIPQTPHTLDEQIVCDADLYHFGTDQFFGHNKDMRKEAEWRLDKKITKNDWRKNTIALMEAHHYHTDFARSLLDEGKKQNLKKLKQKEAEAVGSSQSAVVSQQSAVVSHHPITMGTGVSNQQQQNKPKEAAAKKPKTDRPERGVETMFKISSGNNQRLSDMADNKAHIMITTTSIIISVLLSVLLRKLEDNPQLVVPTMLLLGVCVTTMVFSILATRPALPRGTFTPEDIASKKVNLLFFGNFYRMNFDDYDSGMRQVMNDRDFLYGTLTRDVYSQGVVLGRKYRLLRIGYNVFMYGVVASVLAFVIAVVFFK